MVVGAEYFLTFSNRKKWSHGADANFRTAINLHQDLATGLLFVLRSSSALLSRRSTYPVAQFSRVRSVWNAAYIPAIFNSSLTQNKTDRIARAYIQR